MAEAQVVKQQSKSKKRANQGGQPQSDKPPKRRAGQGTTTHFVEDCKDPLSNNYQYKFEYDNDTFATASHAYYCAKAKFYNEMEEYQNIKDCVTGYDAICLGGKIRMNGIWTKIRGNVMQDIMSAKLKQCEAYRKRLAECTGRIVMIYYIDDFWYTGTEKESKDGTYPGRNILGMVHRDARTELKYREEYPESALAKEYDKLATAEAASGDETPPTSGKDSDEGTQDITDLFASIFETSESMEANHSNDDRHFGESIPVVTAKPPMSPSNSTSINEQPHTSTMSPSVPTDTQPHTSSKAPPSASVNTQPLASNTLRSTNQGKCIWCLTVRDLLPGKKFCARCSTQGTECAHCHRPMPERFFTYSQKLCNACYKRDAKQKVKQRMKTVQ